ncbi:protein phosphatase 1G-like [Ornithodoros turicata]|uniref:protein phosphatase 1G-like n=1 Tax=Ornithodoros turicata TaxID=34597 RepID=UPI0031398C2E
MGAYLSEPVTEKISSDESGKHISYGAASMQGWRINQEDAHNCVIDYDDGDTSFFAVYDGHGGAEVAKYCAMQLPEFIKSLPSYKEGNLETALSEGFLKFDASLVTPEVLIKLKTLTETNSDGDLSGADSTEEDEAGMLEAEADMPIEQVLARYGAKVGMKRGAGKGDEEDDSGGKEEEKEMKLVNGDSSAPEEKEQDKATSPQAQSSSTRESASKAEPGSPSAASSAEPSEQSASCTDQPPSGASESKDDGGEGSSGASGEKSRLRRAKPYTALIMDEEISDSSEDSSESSQDEDEDCAEEEAEEDENDDDEEGQVPLLCEAKKFNPLQLRCVIGALKCKNKFTSNYVTRYVNFVLVIRIQNFDSVTELQSKLYRTLPCFGAKQ